MPLKRISPQLQHAVVAAEDARFFQHHGFDWKEIGTAVGEDLEGNRSRGASTITQQLVRNLFLPTDRSVVRKAEFSIVPLTEGILPKKRILELYRNIIEWGPGVYGAEAASRYYFGTLASRIAREQAVELAEILPAPLHRKPTRITPYGARIVERCGKWASDRFNAPSYLAMVRLCSRSEMPTLRQSGFLYPSPKGRISHPSR